VSEPSIFTKIIHGEIPCHKIYEDEKTFAFLDIHPITVGHILVIPKTEVEFIWDLADDDYAALMATVKKIGQHLRTILAVPYVGIKVVGVDVPHAHVHVVPFTTSTEYNRVADMTAEADHAALATVATKLAL
jgi:histidine triad (HIT) family protein